MPPLSCGGYHSKVKLVADLAIKFKPVGTLGTRAVIIRALEGLISLDPS